MLTKETAIVLAVQKIEKLRAAGWLVVVKFLPAEMGLIIEGSRSEYDAPCPDQAMKNTIGKVCVELMDMKYTRPFPQPFSTAETFDEAIDKIEAAAKECEKRITPPAGDRRGLSEGDRVD